MKSRHAFTLIELLIVVAIIAILAAIAVPNFLEAQVRAKVSRSYTDMRTLAVAMECYRVDTNKYPPDGGADEMYSWRCLTTPVAYTSSIPRDLFTNTRDAYVYYAYDGFLDSARKYVDTAGYLIFGIGPNRRWDFWDFPDYSIGLVGQGPSAIPNMLYDATNGTTSYGELVMTRIGIYNLK